MNRAMALALIEIGRPAYDRCKARRGTLADMLTWLEIREIVERACHHALPMRR